MNLTAISALLAGAIGFGFAWRIQGATITKMELANATRIATESHEAYRRLEKDTTQIVVAQNNKVVRDAVLRADAGAAVAAGNGLRIASADALRAAQADASACYDSIARYGVVLDEVVKAGAEMAVDADRVASDAMMLQQSWPTD